MLDLSAKLVAGHSDDDEARQACEVQRIEPKDESWSLEAQCYGANHKKVFADEKLAAWAIRDSG